MPYSRTWAQFLAHPPGATTQAKDIDNAIQQNDADLAERLPTLITDVTADPWVVRDDVKGKKDGKVIWVPAHAFHSKDASLTREAGRVSYTRATDIARAGVRIPSGVTIVRIDVYADKDSCPSADWQFLKHSLTDADPSALSTVVLASGTTGLVGIRRMQSGALTTVVVDTEWFEVTVDSVGSETFQSLLIYGAKIIINVPDSRST